MERHVDVESTGRVVLESLHETNLRFLWFEFGSPPRVSRCR
jgi:hypothetical protein